MAEGVKLAGKGFSHHSGLRQSEYVFEGVSEYLMKAIEMGAPGELEMRHVVLGHTQWGGSPTSADRILAKRYGVEAMLAYERGETGVMVASRKTR